MATVSPGRIDYSPVRLLVLRPDKLILVDDDETAVIDTGADGGEWRYWIPVGCEPPGLAWSVSYTNQEPRVELRVVGVNALGNEVAELAAFGAVPGGGWVQIRDSAYAAYGSGLTISSGKGDGLGNRFDPPIITGIRVKTRRMQRDPPSGVGAWLPCTTFNSTVTLPAAWKIMFDRADLYRVTDCNYWLRYGWVMQAGDPPLDVSTAFRSGELYLNPPTPPPQATIWTSGQRSWHGWRMYDRNGVLSGVNQSGFGDTIAEGHCIHGGTPVVTRYCSFFDPNTFIITNPNPLSGGLIRVDMQAW